jgi:L-cysteine S-thiosulfotransferase
MVRHPDLRALGLIAAALLAPGAATAASLRVVGDGAPDRLTTAPADAGRGRAAVFDPDRGNCPLCHALPGAPAVAAGTLGPPLAGAGARFSAAQLRLRVADPRRINANRVMPPYFKVDGLTRVDPRWRGRPVLSAQEVEDVVAYLETLK